MPSSASAAVELRTMFILMLLAFPSCATASRRLALTQRMALTSAELLMASQNTNATLSPPGDIRAIVRHMGDPGTFELAHEIASNITWNVSRFTGVAPPDWQHGAGQRGCYNREGDNAFQSAGNEFASWINTSSWTHTVGIRGGGPQAQVYANLNGTVRPWAASGSTLWLTGWFKLPWVSGHLAAPNISGAVAQLGIEYYARDTVSGKSFAGGGAIWDSRPFGYHCGSEFVASDTFTPFASSPIMPGTKYMSAAPGSAHYRNGPTTWSDWVYFGMVVQAEQLEAAARDINVRFPGTNISEDAGSYTLSSILYGNEVTGYEVAGQSMAYGSAVANLSAWVEVEDYVGGIGSKSPA